MPKPNHTDLNTELMDTLGVDWHSHDVVGVTLRLRAGKLPTVTVHRIIKGGLPAKQIAQRFLLTPEDSAPTFGDPPSQAIPSEAES